MKNIYLLVLLLALFSCGNKQETDDIVFRLNITGKKYEGVYLKLIRLDYDTSTYVHGKFKPPHSWEFSIPKKVYESSQAKEFYDTTKLYISLFTVIAGDTVKGALNFDSINEVNAVFEKTNSLVYNMGGMDTTYIWDVLKIPENEGVKLLWEGYSGKAAYDSIDNMWNNDAPPIEYYTQIVKENSGNKVLMQYLYDDLRWFGNKDDVRNIFNNFSETLKESYTGKLIIAFLNQKFENIELVSSESGKPEKIIQDSTKYNFIIFSASWCRPCIQAMPKYKKLYEDFGDKLIFTFISEDGTEDIERWNLLMKKHEIQWRSLFAGSSLKRMNSLYCKNGIPFAMLVAPCGEILNIPLYSEEDLSKFHELVNKL